MTFGEKLKKLRIAKGITRKQMTLELGLSDSLLSKYENDIEYPSIKVRLGPICDMLEVTPSEFFKGVEL